MAFEVVSVCSWWWDQCFRPCGSLCAKAFAFFVCVMCLIPDSVIVIQGQKTWCGYGRLKSLSSWEHLHGFLLLPCMMYVCEACDESGRALFIKWSHLPFGGGFASRPAVVLTEYISSNCCRKVVIPDFYVKIEYSLYAWSKIKCFTHTVKSAHR
jgi:hypothetical protein